MILAVALDDSTIRLFINQRPGVSEFIQTAALKGHEDWVRGLDFYTDHSKLNKIS